MYKYLEGNKNIIRCYLDCNSYFNILILTYNYNENVKEDINKLHYIYLNIVKKFEENMYDYDDWNIFNEYSYNIRHILNLEDREILDEMYKKLNNYYFG